MRATRTLSVLLLTVLLTLEVGRIGAGEFHFASTPTLPPVGSEFRVAIWVKEVRQVVALDLRLAADTLAVELLEIVPSAISRFEWLRWRADNRPGPAVTALTLGATAQGVFFADGDTLVFLRLRRVGAQATTIGLRSGYPAAIDSRGKEVPCTVFPLHLGSVTAVQEQARASDQALCVVHFPNPGRGQVELVLTGVEEGTPARWCVYDALGRLVWEELFAVVSGANRRMWAGSDASGQRLPAGTYFYRLLIGTQEYKGKCVLLR
ncbi:MAG: T9SS type A sorting domain-containing protein [Candidatus Oleimicrobiaceae bacterium]